MGETPSRICGAGFPHAWAGLLGVPVGGGFLCLYCLWCRWCSGRRRPRPPARLGDLTSFGAAPRSPPVPSGPSGALHTGGACVAGASLGASSRSPARPRRRRPAPRPGPATAHGPIGLVLRSLRCPPHQWGRVAVNSLVGRYRRTQQPRPDIVDGRGASVGVVGGAGCLFETGIAFACSKWSILALFVPGEVLLVSTLRICRARGRMCLVLGACCRAQGAGAFFCMTGALRWFQSDCDTGTFVHVVATRTRPSV